MLARKKNKNPWDFPLALPRQRMKRFVKQAIGGALVRLMPETTKRIERTGVAEALVERLIIAGLVARHRRAGTLEALAHFHHRFWAGADAVSVHAENEARFDASVRRHEDFIAAVVGKVERTALDRVCEFGCGTGKLLAILAGRVGKPAAFIGIDLSAEQTARNAKRHEGERLQFVTADALAWTWEHARPNSLYLTYGGVLEYFTEQNVKDLFAAAAKHRPVCFALAEPIDHEFDLAAETRSRAFGNELSFSHNYPRLLKEAGFRIEWQNEVIPGFRWLRVIAVADGT